MRSGLVFTAALTLMTATAASGAQAAKWCGTAVRENSVIECGYSSESECESALNKAGVCFIDPDYAQNGKGTAPPSRHPEAAATSAFTRVFNPKWRPSKGDGPNASAASFEARSARTSG